MRRRHMFNLTHTHSTTGDMGYMLPVMCEECLPGDSFQGDNKIIIRMQPLVAPVMHEVEAVAYTFFAANRLLFKDWELFVTGGQNGMDATVPPTISLTPTVGSLADYFGLPITSNPITVSALPFRALALIYNDFFRDQDLQEEIAMSDESGPDTETNTELLRANWQKDYFTTARPWPQKGDAINIPLGVDAPVCLADGAVNPWTAVNSTTGTPIVPPEGNNYALGVSPNQGLQAFNSDMTSVISYASLNPNGTLFADLSNASTITVNELRQAFAYQRMAETRATSGSRYEDLLHVWGLRTQDFRLQRPELVSIRRTKIQFSEVLQTTPDSAGGGVGAMYGHGISALRSGRWRYYCHEHGWLITLLVVRPKAVYTQGIERKWTRTSRYHYWNPELQHIGQQEVLNKELFADGTSADDEVFGYQNRYDEYRRGKNLVTGEFRSTLDYWNMARVFENRPNLNSEFITCTPTDRIFQASDDIAHQMLIMVRNDVLAKRLISRNGKPI